MKLKDLIQRLMAFDQKSSLHIIYQVVEENGKMYIVDGPVCGVYERYDGIYISACEEL